MFFTRALRSAATIAVQHASKNSAAAVKSGPRLGENWAITEAKRLVPTVITYTAFISAVLGWPFFIRKVDLDIGVLGMKLDEQ